MGSLLVGVVGSGNRAYCMRYCVYFAFCDKAAAKQAMKLRNNSNDGTCSLHDSQGGYTMRTHSR